MADSAATSIGGLAEVPAGRLRRTESRLASMTDTVKLPELATNRRLPSGLISILAGIDPTPMVAATRSLVVEIFVTEADPRLVT